MDEIQKILADELGKLTLKIVIGALIIFVVLIISAFIIRAIKNKSNEKKNTFTGNDKK